MIKKQGYFPAKDVFDAENKTSFFKATTDWFFNPFAEKVDWENPKTLFASRLKLDFVQHQDGRQAANIVVGIPVVKAGSDGTTNGTGQTALSLAAEATSGDLRRRADAMRAAGQYNTSLFTVIGGTPANRSPANKAEFRRLVIYPSSKTDGYMLQAEKCEGAEGGTGGIMPVKDAPRTKISVLISDAYMRTFGEYIIAEWQAHKNAITMQRMMGSMQMASAPVEAPAPQPIQTPAPAPAPVPAPVPAQPVMPQKAWLVVEGKRIGNMGIAVTPEGALNLARRTLKTLQNRPEKYQCMNREAVAGLAQEIASKDGYLTAIQMRSSVDASDVTAVYIIAHNLSEGVGFTPNPQ